MSNRYEPYGSGHPAHMSNGSSRARRSRPRRNRMGNDGPPGNDYNSLPLPPAHSSLPIPSNMYASAPQHSTMSRSQTQQMPQQMQYGDNVPAAPYEYSNGWNSPQILPPAQMSQLRAALPPPITEPRDFGFPFARPDNSQGGPVRNNLNDRRFSDDRGNDRSGDRVDRNRRRRGRNARNPPQSGNGSGRDTYANDVIPIERQCRTLFVRNISYNTNTEEVRSLFAEYGLIKTYFDIISTRGMVFITYYDVRAAIEAKERLQNAKVNRRAIDVHFSLPKDTDLANECDRDKNQGTLSVMIVRGSKQLTEADVASIFNPFGEIKMIKLSTENKAEYFIEFFDSRSCQAAYDALNDTPMFGGRLALRFAWDEAIPVAMVVPQSRLPNNAHSFDPSLQQAGPSLPISPANADNRFAPLPHSDSALPPGSGPGVQAPYNGYQNLSVRQGGSFGSSLRDGKIAAPASAVTDNAPSDVGAGSVTSKIQDLESKSETQRLEEAQRVQQMLALLAGGGISAAKASNPAPPLVSALSSAPLSAPTSIPALPGLPVRDTPVAENTVATEPTQSSLSETPVDHTVDRSPSPAPVASAAPPKEAAAFSVPDGIPANLLALLNNMSQRQAADEDTYKP